MSRISVQVDEEKLARVQQILGTCGVQDTFDRALQEVIRTHLRQRLAARIQSGQGIDRGDELLELTREQR